MAHKKGELLRERPLVEGLRNWVWNIALDALMEWWKDKDPESWQKGVYLCQKQPGAVRGSVLAVGQALYSAIHIAPLVELYEKIPVVGKISHLILDELAEGVEQFPDSVFTYANKQRLPEDYKPEDLDPQKIFDTIAESVKAAPGEVAKRIEAMISHRLPGVTGMFSALAMKLDQTKQERKKHLQALEERKPDLMAAWLAFVGKLPSDAEDDYHRIDWELCTPGVIENILTLPEEQGVVVIRRLAKDTFVEAVGGVVEGFCDAVDPILKRSKELRGRLDEERAKRQKAARAQPKN